LIGGLFLPGAPGKGRPPNVRRPALGCIDADLLSLKAHWKAIVEIYTLRTAPNISDLKIFAKIVEHVANVLIIFLKNGYFF
jgi:hypothetical protein